MKTGFSKVLSVVLCLILMAATASVAFAAAPALPGQGTKADPYQVSDVDGLWELVDNTAAYDGKYIVLTGNLFLNDEVLEPIGTLDSPFRGFFDGQGYSINKFGVSSTENVGLFGYAENASFTNLSLNSAVLSCNGVVSVGTLVGYAKNTEISKVKTNNCTLYAGADAGGIVGTLIDGNIFDCINGSSVNLNAGSNGGGIVGKAERSTILRCINTASVNGNWQKNVGGIVGSLLGTVSHCLNNGTVSSSPSSQDVNESSGVAGIAGFASGEVSFCGNAGNVSSGTNCCGIVAAVDQLTISDCYNAGTLSNGSNYAANSFPIADAAAGNDNCVYEGNLSTKDAYAGWDFQSVWFEPISGSNDHGFPYPMLRDCNLHSLTVSVSAEKATCTDGVEEITYCICGLKESKEIAPALGHNWVVVNVKEANCTYEGEKTYECTRCHEEKPEKDILPVEPDKHVDADNDNICDLCEKTIKEEEVKKSFFQRVIDFFKRIFDWIRNLFTRNKDN